MGGHAFARLLRCCPYKMPGFSFAEGGYVPLRPSEVTVANSEFDVYFYIGCVWLGWVARFMDARDAWLYGYMAQFEWKFEWQSVHGDRRLFYCVVVQNAFGQFVFMSISMV